MQEEIERRPGTSEVTEQNYPGLNTEKPEKKCSISPHLFRDLVLLAGLILLYVLFFLSRPASRTGSQDASAVLPTVNSKVVFVNIDTLNKNYSLVGKLKTELESTGKKLETEILAEQAAFEKEATEFQNAMAANSIPEAKAKGIYETLMKKQQALGEKKDRYTQQVADMELAMHQTLLDTVTAFLKRYNRGNRYDYILGFTQAGQILLANDTLDITKEIVDALNKEYQAKVK